MAERGSTQDLAFVACIERNAVEAQALALFESIRRFGGRFSGQPVYAVAPRPGLGVGTTTQRRLDALCVRYLELPLNLECREYASSNRVLAAAHVEATTAHQILVILDSDTLFLGEPTELDLDADVDVAVRPVDVKGICTAGAGDAQEPYWHALAELTQCELSSLPWLETFVDEARIRACYNGGLVVARAGLGIMRRWAAVFTASVRARLMPRDASPTFRSSTGLVSDAAGRWWGSNQAALALAIWATTDRVRLLTPIYNYPLHLHEEVPLARRVRDLASLVHVHYHWLGEPDAAARNPLLAENSTLAPSVTDWLRARFPLRHASAGDRAPGLTAAP